MPWIVGVDSGGFAEPTIITFGVDLQCNLALPAGGDCPIKIGHGTPSARADLPDLKGLITFVEDFKGVREDRAFSDFLEVEVFLFNRHPRPSRLPGVGSGKERTEKKEDQGDDGKGFFHAFSLQATRPLWSFS